MQPLLHSADTLPDDPLFRNTWPYACLTLAHVSCSTLCERVIVSYGLASWAGEKPEVVHLHSASLREGDHKSQALRLFFAGLELALAGAVRYQFLHQISRLHWLLAERTGRDTAPFNPDGKARDWLQTPALLTLDYPTTLYLEQAGLPLPTDRNRLDLELTNLRRLHAGLVREAAGLDCPPGASHPVCVSLAGQASEW
jgi:hypothetical protein